MGDTKALTVLTASREISRQCHLEEVVGCVNAMSGEMKDAAEVIDARLGLAKCHLSALCAGANMELSISCRSTFGICRHKLTHCRRVAHSVLLKLNFRNDDVVGQYRAAVRAH